jgi:hypothetical protein
MSVPTNVSRLELFGFDPARLEISVPPNRTAMIDWILAANCGARLH